MVIPRGEKGRPANRFPVMTYALIAISILAFVLLHSNAKLVLGEYGVAIGEIKDYVEQNSSKNLKVDPSVFEEFTKSDDLQTQLREGIDSVMGSDLEETFHDDSQDPNFSSARRTGRRSTAQARLDRMVEQAKRVMDDHPGYEKGHDPNNLRTPALFTHLFTSFYLPGLLGTLFIFALVGGFVEVIWGRLFFLICFFAGGIFNAVLYSQFGVSNDPLIGMSGGLMALLGAFVVRYGLSTVYFSYFIGSASLPGFLVVILALAWEAVLPRVMGFGPPPFNSIFVMPYATHAMTLLLGIGIGALFKSTGLEAKINPFDDTEENIAINAIIQTALHSKKSGKLDHAFLLLNEEVRKHPKSTELLLAFWDVAVAHGKPEVAAPKMLQLVRDRLKVGSSDEAVEYWKVISIAHPEVEVDARLLARLALLLGESHREIAGFTLGRFFDDPGEEATPSVAAKLCHLAREIDVVIPVSVAEIALRGNDPDADDRAYLENLVEKELRVDAPQVGLSMDDMMSSDALGGDAVAAEAAVESTSLPLEPSPDPAFDISALGEPDPSDVSAIDVSALEQPESALAGDSSELPDGDLEGLSEILGEDLPGFDESDDLPDFDGGDLADDSASVATVGEASLFDTAGIDLADTGEAGQEEPSAAPAASSDGLSVEDFDNSAIDPSQFTQDEGTGGAGEAPGAEDVGVSDLDPDALSAEVGAEPSEDWSGEHGLFDPSAISLDADTEEAGGDAQVEVDDGNFDPSSLEADPVEEEAELVAPEPAAEVPAEPVVAPPPPVEERRVEERRAEDRRAEERRAEERRTEETPIEEPVQEVAAPAARTLAVREYTPLAFDESAMLLQSESGKKARIPLQQISAISFAGVRGLNEKPVVLVDFVLNWQSSASEPLKVIRLRSDRFSPSSLFPNEASPMDALRGMVAKIVQISQATPLPNETAIAGRPLQMFNSLDDYNREVFGAS